MMRGFVNSSLEPILPLDVLDGSGGQHSMEVRVDSGFDGWLSISPSLVTYLGLPSVGQEVVVLGDGSAQTVPVYRITVVWDGVPRATDVHALDTPPTLGMALLDGYELRIEAKPGGSVTITKLP
jgi:clan AA aspartic protease